MALVQNLFEQMALFHPQPTYTHVDDINALLFLVNVQFQRQPWLGLDSN